MRTLLTFTSESLTVRPWADEVIDRLGFDPRSSYVERFWLAILGPSTTWLLRRLAAGFDSWPEGFELDLEETARSLGLGVKGGPQSAFLRAVNRTIQFELATVTGAHELAVRRRLPPLSIRQQARLSDDLQEAHKRWEEERLSPNSAENQRRRGRQLALSLLELGDGLEEAERQLLRWRYHPDLAHEAAAWAWDRHRAALTGEAG